MVTELELSFLFDAMDTFVSEVDHVVVVSVAEVEYDFWKRKGLETRFSAC